MPARYPTDTSDGSPLADKGAPPFNHVMARLWEGYGADDIAVMDGFDPVLVRTAIAEIKDADCIDSLYRMARREWGRDAAGLVHVGGHVRRLMERTARRMDAVREGVS